MPVERAHACVCVRVHKRQRQACLLSVRMRACVCVCTNASARHACCACERVSVCAPASVCMRSMREVREYASQWGGAARTGKPIVNTMSTTMPSGMYTRVCLSDPHVRPGYITSTDHPTSISLQ
jgi:hypothetical protein